MKNGARGGMLMLVPERDIQRVHQAALSLLEDPGIFSESDLFLDIFEKAGARVDRETCVIFVSPDKATVIHFANEGWDVCLNARRENLLTQIKESLPSGDHLVCPGDYSDPPTAEAIAVAMDRNWGRLDALVNCADVYLGVDAIEAPIKEWRKTFNVMVDGAVYLTRAAAPWIVNGGRVIHITSIHGKRAEAGASGYSMAKAALNQYCRALAHELAPRHPGERYRAGIRPNSDERR